MTHYFVGHPRKVRGLPQNTPTLQRAADDFLHIGKAIGPNQWELIYPFSFTSLIYSDADLAQNFSLYRFYDSVFNVMDHGGLNEVALQVLSNLV